MQYSKKNFTCHWICNFLLLWHEFLHLSMLLTYHCSSGSSLGASSCHLLAGFSCLGHATKHIRCSLCSVHGIKELLTRRSPTCPLHGHWRAGLRCDTCPWSPWLLARSVWPSDEPDWRDCPQGDRIWADVPPNVHAVSCRGLYKVQWETKDTVFPALLPMGNKSRSQVHGSDVCILWEALSWRPGGSEKKLGHSTMPWSQKERCIDRRTLHGLVFSFHLCLCQFFWNNVMSYVTDTLGSCKVLWLVCWRSYSYAAGICNAMGVEQVPRHYLWLRFTSTSCFIQELICQDRRP